MTRLASTAVLLAAALAGCGRKEGAAAGAGKGPGKGPRPFPVEVAPVEAADVVYRIEAPGTLEAWEEIPVVARVSGVADAVDFREGDAVTPDTVLARIDPERFRLQKARSAAVRERAAAALAEAEEALRKREELRAKDPGWVTEEEMTNRRAAVQAAKAAAAEAQAALDLAEKEERDSSVRSPGPGVVDEKRLETGQFVAPGTLLARVSRTDRLRLKFRVPEMESVPLDRKPAIRFTVAAHPGRAFEARVFHVRREADPKTRRVDVLAEVANGDGALRPGFFALATADIETHGRAAVIPESALVPSERGFLAFVAEGGKARERRLQLGLHLKDGRVEVLEGLRAGDPLVVRGAHALEDGVAVQTGGEAGGKGKGGGP